MPRELQKYTRYVNGLDDHDDADDDVDANEDATRHLAGDVDETPEEFDQMQEGRRVLGMAPKPLEDTGTSLLKHAASARLLCIIILVPVLCIAGGILIGSLVTRSHYSATPNHSEWPPQAPVANTSNLPVPRIDEWFENPESIESLSSHFLSHMTPQLIKSYIRNISTTNSDELMSFIQATLESRGFYVKTIVFPVITSTADTENPNTVEFLMADGNSSFVNNASFPVYPFSGFSPNGSASGPLVYANFASEADFEVLAKEGVDINGSVLLVRLGSLHPSLQVRNAEKWGAAGVILYPDPKDFGGTSAYPKGMGLPHDGVVWKNLRVIPGDPSTPNYASQKHTYRVPKEQYEGVPSIPVQPVSADTASRLLSSLNGSQVPVDWKGHLAMDYRFGGGFTGNVTGVRVATYNMFGEQHSHVLLAYLPAQDNSKVIHVGCHYEIRNSRLTSSGIGLASLLAMGDALNQTFPNGTNRRIVLSAFEGRDGDFSAGNEYSQLLTPWLESTAMAYVDMDAVLEGSGFIESNVSPLLRDTVRQALSHVAWPEGVEGLTLDNGLNSALNSNGTDRNAFHFENPYECDESVNFVNVHAIPSIQLTAVSLNTSNAFYLQNSQYDTMDAIIQQADPSLKWTHAIVSAMSVATLSLSSALLPSVRFCEISRDLHSAWQDFLADEKDALEQSQTPLTEILEQISSKFDQFRLTCDSVDTWYKDGTDFKNSMTSFEKFRQVESRLIELMHFGRRFLRPRTEPSSHPTFSSLITYGPSLSDPCEGSHFPFIRRALRDAQEGKGSWDYLSEEITLLLGSLTFMRIDT